MSRWTTRRRVGTAAAVLALAALTLVTGASDGRRALAVGALTPPHAVGSSVLAAHRTAARTAKSTPRLWAVEVSGSKHGWFDRAVLKRVRADGINALILRVSTLGRKAAGKKRFDSVQAFAKAQKLYLVAVLPGGKPHTAAARHASAACSHHSFALLRCAVGTRSVPAAKRLAQRHGKRKLVAAYVRGPRLVSSLADEHKTPLRRILVIAPLHTKFDNTSSWGVAIGETAASPFLDLGVAPQSRKASASVEKFAAMLAGSGSAAGSPPGGNPPPGSPPPPGPPASGTAWAGSFACFGSGSCSGATPHGCTSTISGGLQGALNGASGGQVICLSSGSYGDVSLSSKSFSSDVTVQPASGASVVLGDVTLNAVSHLVVTGVGGGDASLSIDGNDIDESGGCSTHDTFEYLTYTDGVVVEPRHSCSQNMDLLWDHDRFDNLGSDSWEGRFNVQALNTGPHQADGITISNSHFGGSGAGSDCSDGIDILGNADGTTIGPGNEFTGLAQGDCDAHVDPIQFYGEYSGTTITGNWFHANGDGSGGLMSPDEDGGYTVTDNVFQETGVYPWAVVMGGCFNPAPCTVTHNVFINADLEIGTANEGPPTLGALASGNVFDNAGITIVGSGNTFTATYNLNAGVGGTGNINGTPVFKSNPSSGYYHYQLASSSPGYNAAGDGTSIGIGP